MITRRGFLGSILALGVAPAIVRADSLMRIVPRDTTIVQAADLRWANVTARDTTILRSVWLESAWRDADMRYRPETLV